MAILKNMSPVVSICIPFSRNPLPDWSISLASIAPPMNASVQLARTVNMVRDAARDDLVEGARRAGSKFMQFLDDDVTVPPNILRMMLYEFSNVDDDVMVIGGIYCTKSSPATPLVFQEQGEGPFYKWALGEVFPCAIVAAGMMMIRMEVFDHLQKPWFKDVDGVQEGKKYGLIPEDYNGTNFAINDDGFFCAKVRAAGFKVMAHGGVLGIHWNERGDAFLLPDTSYPIRKEITRRWGNVPPKDDLDYWQRVMAVYKDYYGYVDLLPVDDRTAKLVSDSGNVQETDRKISLAREPRGG